MPGIHDNYEDDPLEMMMSVLNNFGPVLTASNNVDSELPSDEGKRREKQGYVFLFQNATRDNGYVMSKYDVMELSQLVQRRIESDKKKLAVHIKIILALIQLPPPPPPPPPQKKK